MSQRNDRTEPENSFLLRAPEHTRCPFLIQGLCFLHRLLISIDCVCVLKMECTKFSVRTNLKIFRGNRRCALLMGEQNCSTSCERDLAITNRTTQVQWTKCVHVCSAASVVSDALQLHEPYPTRLLCPWDFPGKNIGVDCHAQLQGIFLTQESNPRLLCLLH